jgi:hypothetical protein
LALSDYYFCPNLKKHVKVRKFSRTGEATLAADGRFAARPKEFSLGALRKLEQRNHDWVELKGKYIE